MDELDEMAEVERMKNGRDVEGSIEVEIEEASDVWEKFVLLAVEVALVFEDG